MRLAGLTSSWRTSAASGVSRRNANCFVTEFRLGGPNLQNLNQRQNSTKADTQLSNNKRWIADDDETPRITWHEPISWSQPMKGPGCARGEMFNTADQIQDQLHDDGHRVWGFVVYRCTYGDDAAWQTFLERIHASIRQKMEFYHGLDLLGEDCFKLTVHDDASKFDGASVQNVREHFKE